MPGRLIMDEQHSIGSEDLKKNRSHAQEAPSQAQPVSHANGPAHQGPNGVLPNGLPPGQIHPGTNGDSEVMRSAVEAADNPPPLDQSWRTSDSNKPLGLLIERLSQQCYHELNDCLKAMSEVTTEQQPQQPNGVVPYTGPDTFEGSLDKKRKLMDFANSQRDRFIKTLVLTDWARKNEEEQSRLIDIKVWQEKQLDSQAFASRAIGQTKLNMIGAKMPNPNIEGAMELLATGKAAWVPTLNYIQPKRLSTRQLLEALRNMNVILATRLNLHEELPENFRDYSIANGRATFVVKDEFEVDLSVGSEDPSTPFYFVDIRLTFTPAPEALQNEQKSKLEEMVNYQLAIKGLKGGYDFLHNVVLTHKITILRNQAEELNFSGKWVECIAVESPRRNLVVQYWVGMPGPKSWIEFGISSGKQKDGRSRQAPNSQISVRWFRRGIEVKDEALEFDWRNIDVEMCLSTVIEKHTKWILNDLQTHMRDSIPANSSLTIETVDTDSGTFSLSLNSSPLREPILARIEPITGQYCITPPSQTTAHYQRRLNNDPTVDAVKWLTGLVSAAEQERVRKDSVLLGWSQSPVRQDNLQTAFREVVRYLSVYRPSKAWGERWGLAATFSLGGVKWWVVSLEKRREDQDNSPKAITSARQVSILGEMGDQSTISEAVLVQIERLAIAEVAFAALSQQLKELDVPHHFEKLASPNVDDQSANHSGAPPAAMFIKFSALMQGSQGKDWKPWAHEIVRLTHHGLGDDAEKFENDAGTIRHDLRLTLDPGKFERLRKHLSRFGDRDVVMNATGGLSLRLLTTFGQPFAEQIKKRLQSVECLDGYVDTLKKYHYTCGQCSMSRLAFTYSTTPDLSAKIVFSPDGGLPARLKLEPSDSNTHQRIRVFLEQGLNTTADNGFEGLAYVLKLTLPVLSTFERLETVKPKTLSVHPRTATWYTLKYSAPLPVCYFQLRARKKPHGSAYHVRWAIQAVPNLPNGAAWPEDMVKALKEFWESRGQNWEGTGNGIVADAQGIANALEKVDELVRRFEAVGDATRTTQEVPQRAPAEAPNASKQPQQRGKAEAKVENAPKSSAVKKEPDVIELD